VTLPQGQVVMVIRHGEKPGSDGPSRAITVTGVEHKGSLTPVGWARAGALVGLFAPADPAWRRPGLHRPEAVFASNRKGPKGGSHRQEESVSLLAEQLGVITNLDHGVGEEAALVSAVTAARSPVLICWEHKRIPAIAAALGATDSPVPAQWPSARFDVVWVFERAGPDAVWSFTQVPERLLPGDRPELIS
jgi:hypothetical protein